LKEKERWGDGDDAKLIFEKQKWGEERGSWC
jgi:hypothetical protein